MACYLQLFLLADTFRSHYAYISSRVRKIQSAL